MTRELYYRTLFLSAGISEKPAFKMFHSAVRFLDVHLLVRVMQASVRLDVDRQVALRVRHSAKSGAFNFLLSDIDISAYTDDLSESSLKTLRDHVSRWRRIFPFVGELEIYTHAEESQLQGWLGRCGGLYPYLRTMRKIGWMEYFLPKAETDYHRYKVLRSIQACIHRISPGGVARESGNYPKISPQIDLFMRDAFKTVVASFPTTAGVTDASVFNPYYGCSVTFREGSPEGGLALSTQAGLVLLAIAPIASYDDENVNRHVQELRAKEQVGSVWRALTEIEWIVFNGVARAQSGGEPWLAYWRAWIEPALKQVRQNS